MIFETARPPEPRCAAADGLDRAPVESERSAFKNCSVSVGAITATLRSCGGETELGRVSGRQHLQFGQRLREEALLKCTRYYFSRSPMVNISFWFR